jgi:hypothetical protein
MIHARSELFALLQGYLHVKITSLLVRVPQSEIMTCEDPE